MSSPTRRIAITIKRDRTDGPLVFVVTLYEFGKFALSARFDTLPDAEWLEDYIRDGYIAPFIGHVTKRAGEPK